MFTDDAERLWNAATRDGALVFTCISDGRQSSRAIAVDALRREPGHVTEEVLRAWLAAAPRIGTLP